MKQPLFLAGRTALFTALLIVAGAGGFVLWAEYVAPALRAANHPTSELSGDQPNAATIQRGAYLARVGNCSQCHTQPGSPAYSGGVPLSTPFGTVFSSNLTPDPATGLGHWTRADFWRAMHKGERPDGTVLNPAFPYTSFTGITRADADALFDYFQTLPAVSAPGKPHQLRWPLGTQTALNAWRILHFRPADEVNSSAVTQTIEGAPSVTRGAYLARSLGHCTECHTPRNALGGLRSSAEWNGATLPDGQWYAPALNDTREAGLASWPVADIVTLFTHGQQGNAFVAGPMAEVVLHSTQHLTADDATSLAMYLRTIGNAEAATPRNQQSSKRAEFAAGARIYDKECAQCHGKQGEGQADAYPALAGNRAVLMDNTNNLVLSVLHGGYGSSTAGKPRPYGMPPYQLVLNDSDLASVLSHIRNSWGNQAAPVTEFDINRIRNAPTR